MSSHTLALPLTSKSKRKVDPNPRTRYAHITSAAPTGSGAALALSNEVQLSKLLDGGSTERNVQRVMAGAAAKSGRAHGYGPDAHVGVTAPYRGEHGGELWWDEEERWEKRRASFEATALNCLLKLRLAATRTEPSVQTKGRKHQNYKAAIRKWLKSKESECMP